MMKRILSAFLLLLMLMPSMACAMPVCAKEKQVQAAQSLPCHGHENTQVKPDAHNQNKTSGAVKFLKDCMGVDFQVAADSPAPKQPGLSSLVDWAMPFVVPMPAFSASDKVAAVCGPPPDWPDIHSGHTPVYLTTQRLRI